VTLTFNGDSNWQGNLTVSDTARYTLNYAFACSVTVSFVDGHSNDRFAYTFPAGVTNQKVSSFLASFHYCCVHGMFWLEVDGRPVDGEKAVRPESGEYRVEWRDSFVEFHIVWEGRKHRRLTRCRFPQNAQLSFIQVHIGWYVNRAAHLIHLSVDGARVERDATAACLSGKELALHVLRRTVFYEIVSPAGDLVVKKLALKGEGNIAALRKELRHPEMSIMFAGVELSPEENLIQLETSRRRPVVVVRKSPFRTYDRLTISDRSTVRDVVQEISARMSRQIKGLRRSGVELQGNKLAWGYRDEQLELILNDVTIIFSGGRSLSETSFAGISMQALKKQLFDNYPAYVSGISPDNLFFSTEKVLQDQPKKLTPNLLFCGDRTKPLIVELRLPDQSIPSFIVPAVATVSDLREVLPRPVRQFYILAKGTELDDDVRLCSVVYREPHITFAVETRHRKVKFIVQGKLFWLLLHRGMTDRDLRGYLAKRFKFDGPYRLQMNNEEVGDSGAVVTDITESWGYATFSLDSEHPIRQQFEFVLNGKPLVLDFALDSRVEHVISSLRGKGHNPTAFTQRDTPVFTDLGQLLRDAPLSDDSIFVDVAGKLLHVQFFLPPNADLCCFDLPAPTILRDAIAAAFERHGPIPQYRVFLDEDVEDEITDFDATIGFFGEPANFWIRQINSSTGDGGLPDLLTGSAPDVPDGLPGNSSRADVEPTVGTATKADQQSTDDEDLLKLSDGNALNVSVGGLDADIESSSASRDRGIRIGPSSNDDYYSPNSSEVEVVPAGGTAKAAHQWSPDDEHSLKLSDGDALNVSVGGLDADIESSSASRDRGIRIGPSSNDDYYSPNFSEAHVAPASGTAMKVNQRSTNDEEPLKLSSGYALNVSVGGLGADIESAGSETRLDIEGN
jgi:hypothetical protein